MIRERGSREQGTGNREQKSEWLGAGGLPGPRFLRSLVVSQKFVEEQPQVLRLVAAATRSG